MKKILILFAFIPLLLNGQTPTSSPYIDISKYLNDNRVEEMVDSNFISLNKVFNVGDSTFHVKSGTIDNTLLVNDSTLFVDGVNNKVGIGTLSPANQLDIVGSEIAVIADIHNLQSTGIGAWQVINDLSRRASFGIAGSANPIVQPHSLAIYQQGYGSTYFIVDGNKPFIWSTDVNDAHLLGYTEKMRLTPGGELQVDTIDTDSIALNAITYKDTYWDDLRVPLSNTKINPAQSEPDYEDNGTGAFSWGFDADSDSAYVLNFEAQIPHSYKVGTDLDAHLHWLPPTTNTGVVRWKLTYWYAAIDSVVAGPFYFWVNDPGDGLAHKHQLADFGDIDGSTLGISSMIWGQLARLGEHTDDTFTGSAYAVEVDFHYQLNAPGSEEELIKY